MSDHTEDPGTEPADNGVGDPTADPAGKPTDALETEGDDKLPAKPTKGTEL